ncbi:MAG: hypothetical protein CL610_10195 [Anaerolineaceae bacterium]|nr:hypothetical protein [Anaerolineaceae bacterium]
MGMVSVRVLIVDDHPQVRMSLRLGLDLWDDLIIVGEASNGMQAVELVNELQPDVVLMDLDMPGIDGAETTQILCSQNPRLRVLILTGTVDYDRINVALEAGATDYLFKTARIDEIGEAIIGAARENSS